MTVILIDGSVKHGRFGGAGIVIMSKETKSYSIPILTSNSSVTERVAAVCALRLLGEDTEATIKTDCMAVMRCIMTPRSGDILDEELNNLLLKHPKVRLVLVNRNDVQPAHNQARKAADTFTEKGISKSLLADYLKQLTLER